MFSGSFTYFIHRSLSCFSPLKCISFSSTPRNHFQNVYSCTNKCSLYGLYKICNLQATSHASVRETLDTAMPVSTIIPIWLTQKLKLKNKM